MIGGYGTFVMVGFKQVFSGLMGGSSGRAPAWQV
jgi:hypothetical protein